ncbi:MAG: urease accessory protein UreF [Beijerinckiaceae bacterium]|nr:urease accessory protein UreF [Beijerinckiaceae bacterium]
MRLLQFGDSTFPIGGFSFSCGLESAIQTKLVRCIDTLREFVLTAVEQSARGDAIAMLCAHQAATLADIDQLLTIDRHVHARKMSEEARTMTTRMGRKFVELNCELIKNDLLAQWRNCIETSATPGCFPVALGITFAVQRLPARTAFVVHQYGVTATILSAALRLLKVSHVDTQKVLYEVNELSEDAFLEASNAHLSDMAGFSPETDILLAYHTKAHVRLFMS